MKEKVIAKPLSGWWVFTAFAAFFGVVIIVNGIFIASALGSFSGLVTEQPYKKGLAYNEVLEHARTQPNVDHKVSFQEGVLRWDLKEQDGTFVKDASVTANFTRPVKDGNDFSMPLHYQGKGLYLGTPEFPFKGLWAVQLSAKWNNQTYKTTKQIIVR